MESDIRIPGEAKDRIIKHAYERIAVLEAEDVPSSEALPEVMAWLMDQEEVEEVKEFHKMDLTVRFVDGTQIGILLGRRQVYGPLGGPRVAKGGNAASKPDLDQSDRTSPDSEAASSWQD